MPRALLLVLLGALGSAACSSDQAVTSPTTTPARTTEIFMGSLPVGGSQFYSFLSSDTGTTDVTFVSLRPAGSTTATLTAAMGLGLGTPAGTDCALTSAMTALPGLAAPLSVTTSARIYCVKIADVGNLRSTADYTVRILHP